MSSRFGLPELLDELRSSANPLYGAPEAAEWHLHRARSIANALGVALGQAPPALLALLRHRIPHPADRALEYSLVEKRYERELAPIHAASRALGALYGEESLRLAEETWGARATVDHQALIAAGLDPSREPDWGAIIEREI
jgi:hypothetical protein